MNKLCITLVVLSMVLVVCCGSKGCPLGGPLGPMDSPDFTSKEWKSLEFHYWLVETKASKKERTLTISDMKLEELIKSLHVQNARGMSVGNDAPSIFTLENGQEWRFEIGVPDRIYFALKSDTYYHYVVNLKDTDFYETLKAICYENEQKLTPNVVIENIKICSGGRPNLFRETYIPLDETTNDRVVSESQSTDEDTFRQEIGEE